MVGSGMGDEPKAKSKADTLVRVHYWVTMGLLTVEYVLFHFDAEGRSVAVLDAVSNVFILPLIPLAHGLFNIGNQSTLQGHVISWSLFAVVAFVNSYIVVWLYRTIRWYILSFKKTHGRQ